MGSRMNELQKAIDSLRINDVYLRSSHTSLADDFDPKFDGEKESLEVQFKHIVSRSDVVALGSEDSGENLFRVFIDFGARWVESAGLGKVAPEKEEPAVKAVIEGVMVAEYMMIDDPGTEALKAFAFNNASFHVWPYWREFLSAQCLRMNLPKVMIPAKQFAANRSDSGSQEY